MLGIQVDTVERYSTLHKTLGDEKLFRKVVVQGLC